ncbi:MAG: hypothetical protein A3G93_02495 [Nitrospinae bacterium RIFCSPLOWO2_12_FULL_45_22]|nr:MAG: hypothetical protein A3G93_02495 [Nitrospinae bacterium RIFCSPLOWO2_12_FULL_45_22]
MKRFCSLLAFSLFLFWPLVSWATDEELLMLLKTKGVITQEEMDGLLERVKGREKKDKTLNAFYKDGFQVQTVDKSFKMQVGGRVQGDYLGLDNNDTDDSSFTIRRARIFASGDLFKHTDFKGEIDFGQGNDASLTDGYLNFKYLKWAQLRIGQYKEPFSLEELTSSRYIDFVERSTLNSLVPARDIGLMVHSEFLEGTIGYGLGIFNGSGLNQRRDQNDDKDIAGRLYFRPFAQSESMFLKGLQLATNFTVGNQEGGLSTIRTPAARTSIISWASGVKSDDRRTRFGADLAWVIGPFSLKSEYIRADWDNLRLKNRQEDFDIQGWYVTGSIFLTGEEKPFKEGAFGRLKKVHSFDPQKSGWGAWELLARYDTLRADDDIFDLGYATGTDRINAFTVGLNWYPHNMVTVKFNYVHNSYDDNLKELEGDDSEDLFLTRLQVEF